MKRYYYLHIAGFFVIIKKTFLMNCFIKIVTYFIEYFSRRNRTSKVGLLHLKYQHRVNYLEKVLVLRKMPDGNLSFLNKSQCKISWSEQYLNSMGVLGQS